MCLGLAECFINTASFRPHPGQTSTALLLSSRHLTFASPLHHPPVLKDKHVFLFRVLGLGLPRLDQTEGKKQKENEITNSSGCFELGLSFHHLKVREGGKTTLAQSSPRAAELLGFLKMQIPGPHWLLGVGTRVVVVVAGDSDCGGLPGL